MDQTFEFGMRPGMDKTSERQVVIALLSCLFLCLVSAVLGFRG